MYAYIIVGENDQTIFNQVKHPIQSPALMRPRYVDIAGIQARMADTTPSAFAFGPFSTTIIHDSAQVFGIPIGTSALDPTSESYLQLGLLL